MAQVPVHCMDNGIIYYKGYGMNMVIPWKQMASYPVLKKMYHDTRGKLLLRFLAINNNYIRKNNVLESTMLISNFYIIKRAVNLG